ncbi:pyroglutamylated RF-amide peptide receptor-like [Physella acuta]|uniref:pyroglutamylated RF-amide peptide receptor-like n=1 Tax=Physella acuta TaxID=109671 RepID=UPI0027DC9427|nr:pyroglutamylated RF-amide peptide receptor-like [Physella acuta]
MVQPLGNANDDNIEQKFVEVLESPAVRNSYFVDQPSDQQTRLQSISKLNNTEASADKMVPLIPSAFYIAHGTDAESWQPTPAQNNLYYDEDGNTLDIAGLELNFYQFFPAFNLSHPGEDSNTVPVTKIVTLAMFAFIFILGVVGNILVICTLSRNSRMRTVTNLFFFNLSTAQLLYLLVCLPTLSISHALVDWPFGLILCKLNNYVMSVTMSVSVLTITATGLDRYIAVMYPVKSRVLRTTKNAVVVIIVSWIISLVVMAPRMLLYKEMKIYHVSSHVRLCYRVESLAHLQLDTCLNFLLMYLLPLLVLSVCHFRIGRKLWNSTRPGHSQSGQLRTVAINDRRRIAKIVFAITIVFAVGWLPIHIYHITEDFNQGQVLFGQVVDRGTIVLFFSFGANAMNPILYCMFSSSFRKHFKKIFHLCGSARFSSSVHNDGIATFIPLNKRTPAVLLPRPASLISDLPNNTIFKEVGPVLPLLTEQTECKSRSPEHRNNSSPLSVGKLAHIELVSYQELSLTEPVSRLAVETENSVDSDESLVRTNVGSTSKLNRRPHPHDSQFCKDIDKHCNDNKGGCSSKDDLKHNTAEKDNEKMFSEGENVEDGGKLGKIKNRKVVKRIGMYRTQKTGVSSDVVLPLIGLSTCEDDPSRYVTEKKKYLGQGHRYTPQDEPCKDYLSPHRRSSRTIGHPVLVKDDASKHMPTVD